MQFSCHHTGLVSGCLFCRWSVCFQVCCLTHPTTHLHCAGTALGKPWVILTQSFQSPHSSSRCPWCLVIIGNHRFYFSKVNTLILGNTVNDLGFLKKIYCLSPIFKSAPSYCTLSKFILLGTLPSSRYKVTESWNKNDTVRQLTFPEK